MTETKRNCADKTKKQVVQFAIIKLHIKERANTQIVPENKLCDFLNQINY